MEENKTQNVDLFSMDSDDSTMSFLTKQKRNSDGIYRNKLDQNDLTKTAKSTIRFLPNLLEGGKAGISAIPKHIHYVKINNDNLKGYYECNKNYEDKCPLCSLFWKFDKSNNAAEKEKASLVARNTKYYSYVLIIEDELQPELVGQIMIFQYGQKIKAKIEAEHNGEIDGKCNVFSVENGKDFRLIVKNVKDANGKIYPNYDSSSFLKRSPLKVWDAKGAKFHEAKVDESGKIVDQKWKDKILSFLTDRTVKLEDHKAIRWDEEVKAKVDNIISYLTGNEESSANNAIRNARTNISSSIDETPVDTEEMDDFFNK